MSCVLGFDGEELNVLDDILGEPANDEFAAELDNCKAARSTSKWESIQTTLS